MADAGASAAIAVTVAGASASASEADTLEVDLSGDLAVDAADPLEVSPGVTFVGKSAAVDV
jgi:hypothetical protein